MSVTEVSVASLSGRSLARGDVCMVTVVRAGLVSNKRTCACSLVSKPEITNIAMG